MALAILATTFAVAVAALYLTRRRIRPNNIAAAAAGAKPVVFSEHVLEHDEHFRQLGPSLWCIGGTLGPYHGLPRTMVVHRQQHNLLVLHSVIALSEQQMRELEALGTVSIIIVPSTMHTRDAAAYKARYPSATLVCPKKQFDKIKLKVAVEATCEEVLPAHGVAPLDMPGNPFELCYQMPLDAHDASAGYAFVVCDALFNLPANSGWIAYLMGSSGFFGVTRIGRLLMPKESKVLFARWLRRMASTEPLLDADTAERFEPIEWRAIIMAHGEPIVSDCHARLREAADRLCKE